MAARVGMRTASSLGIVELAFLYPDHNNVELTAGEQMGLGTTKLVQPD